jgi:uncharacterized protein (DUF488 family)
LRGAKVKAWLRRRRTLGIPSLFLGCMDKPQIWTIGHSVHPLEEFVAWLQSFQIAVLADVRSYPGLRRLPWFNKEVLPAEMAAAGLEYVHIRTLGGRRKLVAGQDNSVWRHPAFRGYADYMMTDPAFEEGLAELKTLALARRTCMMCSEVLWWRCHRSMISDRLKADGWQVHHIMGLDKEEEHPYTAPARIVNGQLAYGAKDSELPFAR